jgi:phosphoglycerate dehydrogenase-like enzyme
MSESLLPPPAEITIGFAHPAYQLEAEFLSRRRDVRTRLARSTDELSEILPDCHVLVASGLWRNALMEQAKKLRFLQSVSAGINNFDLELFKARGVRLASAQGANERAVAEHALALMLSLTRHLHFARDRQRERHWRPMLSDPTAREQESGGRHVVVVGFGRIGSRFGKLAQALGCRVTGLRRSPAAVGEGADAMAPMSALLEVLATADVVVLTCPLTPETINLIGAAELAAMKPSAHLINVARGAVVDEKALVAALQRGALAAAALDVTAEEPLPDASPLWAMPNVIITPHSAGETGRYEENVIDLLVANLDRLWRGDEALVNRVA